MAETPVAQRSVSGPLSRVAGKVLGWYFPAFIRTAIWAITDFGGYFWPIWVFFGLSIPAAARAPRNR